MEKEIQFAVDLRRKEARDIRLIPVMLDDCVIPPHFRGYQVVDLFAEDGFTHLLRAITQREDLQDVLRTGHDAGSRLKG